MVAETALQEQAAGMEQAGSAGNFASGTAAGAQEAGVVAAGRAVAEQMAGLQQLMMAEAGKHCAAFDDALKVRGKIAGEKRWQCMLAPGGGYGTGEVCCTALLQSAPQFWGPTSDRCVFKDEHSTWPYGAFARCITQPH